MTETSHLSPKATDEQRLPWHRRPRTLLGFVLVALLSTIPFAIRGYQLSQIPDIEDPFADLPPIKARPEPKTDDPIVRRFLERAKRLNDDAYWLSVEEPSREQRREFDNALRHAVHHGLEDAPPEVDRFVRENGGLLDEWHLVLELYARKPPHHDFSRWIHPRRFSTAMKLLFWSRAFGRESSQPLNTVVESLSRLHHLQARTLSEFGVLMSMKRRLREELVRASELAAADNASLVASLSASLQWQPTSPELRLAMLHSFYAAELAALESRVPQSNNVSSWEIRQFMYLMGEPDLSKRVVRQLYTGYRQQLNLPHSSRVKLSLLASGDVEWFEGTGGPNVTRRHLETAFNNSVILSEIKLRTLSPLFSPNMIQLVERETAQIRNLRVSLACQLYLRERGTLPESLTALVPEYLPAVPEDPLKKSDPHLLYRNDGPAAVVYSRGWNGTDDGGLAATSPDSDWHGDDFGILIRDLINHPEQTTKPK